MSLKQRPGKINRENLSVLQKIWLAIFNPDSKNYRRVGGGWVELVLEGVPKATQEVPRVRGCEIPDPGGSNRTTGSSIQGVPSAHLKFSSPWTRDIQRVLNGTVDIYPQQDFVFYVILFSLLTYYTLSINQYSIFQSLSLMAQVWSYTYKETITTYNIVSCQEEKILKGNIMYKRREK